MQSLGDALAKIRPMPPPGALDDPEWIDAQLLTRPMWPTPLLEAELARARVELDAGDVQRLERQLDLAKWRDRLQEGRPADCWCFGIGGRGRVAYGFDGEGEAIQGWRTACSCPEAQQVKLSVARRKAEAERVHAQAILDRLFGSLPFGYQGWTLDTLRDQSADHQRLAERIVRWLDEPDRWLYLHGPVGTGKTGAAVGVIRALADRGYSSLFVEVADLLRRLRASYSDPKVFAESQDAAWEALVGVQALLVDDIGAERHRRDAEGNVDWATEVLWNLIATRHRERRRTIFTSNHSLNELTDILGHPRTTSRISELALVLDCARLPDLRSKGEVV